jgi:hypothetical protein
VATGGKVDKASLTLKKAIMCEASDTHGPHFRVTKKNEKQVRFGFGFN